MKKVLALILLVSLFGCSKSQPKPSIFIEDNWKMDSITHLNYIIDSITKNKPQGNSQYLLDEIELLNDSIEKLNEKPLMSEKQFVNLYKYDRIVKYYTICKRNPSQYKYFKGWIIRVIEE